MEERMRHKLRLEHLATPPPPVALRGLFYCFCSHLLPSLEEDVRFFFGTRFVYCLRLGRGRRAIFGFHTEHHRHLAQVLARNMPLHHTCIHLTEISANEAIRLIRNELSPRYIQQVIIFWQKTIS